MNSNYSLSHIGKGPLYDSRFHSAPLDEMWNQEKAILKIMLNCLRPLRVLDLACGTGRISSFLAAQAPSAEITGIDISDSMLQIARKKSTSAVRYIRANMAEIDLIKTESAFDLITCFRFITNAENDLRLQMIECAARHASKGAILVLNNHQNIDSIPLRLQNTLKREEHGISNSAIVKLVENRDFKLLRTFSLGVTPQDERKYLLPTTMSKALERINLKFLAPSHKLGINQIMIFQVQ